MADKKVFSIQIDGIKQSVDGVTTLGKATNQYTDYMKETRKALKNIKSEMAGLDKNSKQWKELAKQAGAYKDKIDDINQATRRWASDTKQLDDAINIGQSMTSVFTLAKGAMTEFGASTENTVVAIQKMQGAMAIIQSLQTLQNTMKGSTATAELMNGAFKALTLGIEGTSLATKALKLSLATLGIGVIIMLVDELVESWDDITDSVNDSLPILNQLGGAMNVLKAIFKSVGNVILHFLINPWKTFAEMVTKVLEGDFKGAIQAAIEGVARQSIGALTEAMDGWNTQVQRGLDDMNKKTAEATAKQVQYDLDMLKAIKGNEGKYSREGIEMQKKVFEARRQAAKDNEEELKKIALDEANFNRECEEYKTRQAEKGAKDRTNMSKEEFEERKKILEAALKAQQDFEAEVNAIREKAIKEEEKRLERLKALKDKDSKAEEAYQKQKLKLELVNAQTDEEKIEIKKKIIALDQEIAEKEAKIAAANAMGISVDELNSRLQNTQSTYMGLKADQQQIMQTLITQLSTVKMAAEEARNSLNSSTTTPTKKDEKTGAAKFTEKANQVINESIAPVADTLGALGDSIGMMFEMAIEQAEAALQEAEELHDQAVEKVEDSKDRISELNEKMKDSSGAQLDAYKQQMADEILLLQQREEEERRLQKEKEKREKQLEREKKKQRRIELMTQLSDAIASGALAVVNGLATKPFVPLGIAMGAMAGAATAIQVATITKQLSKMADGGLIVGRSHAQGGVPVGNTGIEVEGDEFVVNKRSTAKYLPLLDAINAEGNGGKHTLASTKLNKFADGGQLNYERINSNMDALNTAKAVTAAIGGIDIHPVVSVQEISRVQKNLVSVRELAGANN